MQSSIYPLDMKHASETHPRKAPLQGGAALPQVSREGSEMTRVAIKVGYVGDKGIGHAIIAETKKRLE